MFKELIKSIVDNFGYLVRKKSALFYDLEKEASDAIKTVRPYTMLPHERLLSLFKQVEYCEKAKIPGCYVECGVWKGGSVGLMALANMKYSHNPRQIHLFDSFQEICEPDALVDGVRAINEAKKWSKGDAGGKLKPLTGIYDSFGGPGSLEGNKELLERIIGYNPMFLHYHKGWFQDTLPQTTNIDKIAILRLDCDWYASTKICLENLYDKVVPGGFVIIDDYGTYDGCRKAVDEFMRDHNVKAFLNYVDMDCIYWIIP